MSKAIEDTKAYLREVATTFANKRFAATSSFGAQSAAFLHLINHRFPGIPILFLETGFHFPETLAFVDGLKKRLDLNIIFLRAEIAHKNFVKQHGEDAPKRNPDFCCQTNKVEPLDKALKDYDAWFTGLRKETTADRQKLSREEVQENGPGNYIVKINPLIDWTRQDLDQYLEQYQLPRHFLAEAGFRSIGCAPCTHRVLPGQGERDGRWAESNKTECGIHLKPKRIAIEKPRKRSRYGSP